VERSPRGKLDGERYWEGDCKAGQGIWRTLVRGGRKPLPSSTASQAVVASVPRWHNVPLVRALAGVAKWQRLASRRR